MARTYAAIMALLAMLVVMLRAMKDHAGFEGTITTAFVWMAMFGAIGLLVGAIARSTVDQSILKAIEDETTAATSPSEPKEKSSAT